jgi:DNA-binding winged helix-turn-helix (wHTH) protein
MASWTLCSSLPRGARIHWARIATLGARDSVHSNRQTTTDRGTGPASANTAVPVQVGSVEIDVLRQTVRVGGATYQLTGASARLLYLLAANAGRVVTREEIKDALGWLERKPSSNAVDQQIRDLRLRLRDVSGVVIETTFARGYRFVPPDYLATGEASSLAPSSPRVARPRARKAADGPAPRAHGRSAE